MKQINPQKYFKDRKIQREKTEKKKIKVINFNQKFNAEVENVMIKNQIDKDTASIRVAEKNLNIKNKQQKCQAAKKNVLKWLSLSTNNHNKV